MKKIDSHVHIYKQICGYGGRGELLTVGGGKAIWANGDTHYLIPEGMGESSFEADRLLNLMNENQVEKAVILQGNLYGFQNRYIHETVQKYPDRLIGACAVDPFARHGVELMEHFLRQGFRIAKFEFSDSCGLMSFHQKFSLNSDRMYPYYRLLEERQGVLTVDIGAMGMDSYQPEAILQISDKFPGLKIVICHLLAHKKGEEKILRQELEMLNQKNIWFDLAAVPWNAADESYPFGAALENIKTAKEVIGYRKMLWGSDAPAVILRDSYKELYQYLEESQIFTEAEKESIFYKNAQEVYFNGGNIKAGNGC